MATRRGRLSEAALRLRERGHELDFPVILWQQFDAGLLSDFDLLDLLPRAWMYREGPERLIGAAKWVEMFRVAGPMVVPTNLPAPLNPVELFRGATEERSRGMAWYFARKHAEVMKRRHDQFGPTLVYTVTAPSEAVLAVFQRPGDGMEAVVDPELIGEVRSLA